MLPSPLRKDVWLLSCLFAASLLGACNQGLVDEVPPEVCASGERWIGGVTGNEWMYPGNDCVGCHAANGGPELIAGGTIYGVPDADGAVTTAADCFGVEGVLVTITGADGTVLQTHTNRAGNFYFEGRQTSLVKPFNVVIEHTDAAGTYSRAFMNTSPSYGGCARCHKPSYATPTPGIEGGGVLGPNDVVEGVFPIYTGPVLE
ncbi:MAG: hypothetical protein RL033_1855 [Pseudomonadota bacterium]|jgi:hypothetical protein